MSVAQRKFFAEISALADRHVIVSTTTGKTFTGMLVGINPDNLGVCLADAKDEEGKVLNRVILNGSVVAQILSIEKPFDLRALAERLEKVFPTMVKLYEDKEYKKRVPRNLIGITSGGIIDVIYKNTNFTFGDRYMREVHGCTIIGALDGGSSASALDKLGKSSYSESHKDRVEAAVANFIILYEN